MGKEDAEVLLAATSPSFRALHHELGRRMNAAFPQAEPLIAYGMVGWQVAVPDPPAAEDWRGTMDREHLQVLPSEKKAGITTHIWDPKNPALLKDHEARLREAGFKVMVGCLQWNRKAPFPVDAVEDLLRAAKQAW